VEGAQKKKHVKIFFVEMSSRSWQGLRNFVAHL